MCSYDFSYAHLGEIQLVCRQNSLIYLYPVLFHVSVYIGFVWQFVGKKNSSKCGISARL